jgi:predicted metal-dependent phosphoesterase TrpH
MTSRVDMHCHSTASHFSKLGVQRSLGPECATLLRLAVGYRRVLDAGSAARSQTLARVA